MSTWDGINRRAISGDHDILVEMHAIVKSNSERMKKHEDILYGNGKPGLNGIPKILEDHARMDIWIAGIFITIQLAILGKLLLK